MLRLRSRSDRAPYLRFLSVIRSTLKWMNAAAPAARTSEFDEQFELRWAEQGPVDHPHNTVYRSAARQMLRMAQRELMGENLDLSREALVGTRRVLLQADNIRVGESQIVVQRLKAGRLAKKETQRTRDKLLFAAVSRDYPTKPVVFEHVSLLTGDRAIGATKSDSKITDEVTAVPPG
ncbi:hypothetical protein [Mesorhizobium sp.]|uniref:hypothetical protein n=1 Tax=Mesorhizobium sp. TaxID=1871066 RepID=UPI0025796962|nr:hypothetical protein [Mesorhizobium sp.]